MLVGSDNIVQTGPRTSMESAVEYIQQWPPVSAKRKEEQKDLEHNAKEVQLDLVQEKDSKGITNDCELHLEEWKIVEKEADITTRSLLAQWWKWKRREVLVDITKEKFELPISSNPNTLLYHLTKIPQTRKLMNHRIQFLNQKLKSRQVLTSLAECHQMLGNTKIAMKYVQQALEGEPHNNEVQWQWHLINKQYSIAESQEMFHVLLERDKSLTNCSSLPTPAQVQRRDAGSLSFKSFLSDYAMTHTPVIITGLKLTSASWTLDYLQKMIGHKTAPLRQPVAGSVEWAGLESAGECNIADFIDDIRNRKPNLGYLFDWSLPIYCPEMVRELTIPKYFAGDFLQHTPTGSMYRDSWPSLFVAPAGITSALHIDSFGSNFWMALFEGRKRWLFFPPEDLPCLYPVYTHSIDAVFEVDLAIPDLVKYPLLSYTHPKECVLQPGEVLFVPAGCPHQVDTIDPSVAISANFIDLSNIELVKKELKIISLLYPRANELLLSLEEEELSMDEYQESLVWTQFKTWPRKFEDKTVNI